ncbi:holo-ACP synthase [Thermosulfurimonas sp.]|uniref:holo-ACP synthase n=1 Tax=Thermosulfurimonas sp. TaxID=2080236 RepID=UPI0025E919FF|nr:holo-ACP synthase [Thermosulfurimonas sp.]
MICGLGVDLVQVERVERLLRNYGERFLRRIFSEEEIAYARSKSREAEALAASFAAKEALGKALGTGISGFSPREVALVRDPRSGQPGLFLRGRAREMVFSRADRLWVSITHEAGLALAVVVLEKGG